MTLKQLKDDVGIMRPGCSDDAYSTDWMEMLFY